MASSGFVPWPFYFPPDSPCGVRTGDLVIGEDPIGDRPSVESKDGDAFPLNGEVLSGGVEFCEDAVLLSRSYTPNDLSSNLLLNISPIRDDLG